MLAGIAAPRHSGAPGTTEAACPAALPGRVGYPDRGPRWRIAGLVPVDAMPQGEAGAADLRVGEEPATPLDKGLVRFLGFVRGSERDGG